MGFVLGLCPCHACQKSKTVQEERGNIPASSDLVTAACAVKAHTHVRAALCPSLPLPYSPALRGITAFYPQLPTIHSELLCVCYFESLAHTGFRHEKGFSNGIPCCGSANQTQIPKTRQRHQSFEKQNIFCVIVYLFKGNCDRYTNYNFNFPTSNHSILRVTEHKKIPLFLGGRTCKAVQIKVGMCSVAS